MYDRILHAFYSEPWAMLESKFAAIESFLLFAADGGKYSAEEVKQKIGEKVEREAYALDPESGERMSFSALEARAAAGNGSGKKGGNLVAVIPIAGTIMPKASMLSNFSGGASVESITKQFRSALNNPEVRAIVLDIDSPGGSVYGVDELASEIRAGREQKKIVAQVSPLAASAAYYLASAANEIAITPSGEAGSIGVFLAHRDLSKAYADAGINTTLISAGKYKVESNPYGPLSDEARTFLQSRINDYYDAFVKSVADGRGVSVKDVRNGFGEGRVLGAEEGKARRPGGPDRHARQNARAPRRRVDERSRADASGRGSRTSFRQRCCRHGCNYGDSRNRNDGGRFNGRKENGGGCRRSNGGRSGESSRRQPQQDRGDARQGGKCNAA
jgi:signal peptide peptidase SppA